MNIITKKEAKEQNLKFYYTGKPCKRGHICERYVSECRCVECKKEHNKQWRDANPEYFKQHNKQYYADNKEHIKQHNKQWRDANPEYFKQWRENNPEYCAKKSRERKGIEKQATPQWFEKHKINKLYKLAALMAETWGTSFHIDHIVPLQNPSVCGLYCFDNLQILEANKNLSKSNKLDTEIKSNFNFTDEQ